MLLRILKKLYVNYFCSCGNRVSERLLENNFSNYLEIKDWEKFSYPKKLKYIKENIEKVIIFKKKIKEVVGSPIKRQF